ncbi:hypothetical protein DXG01_003774 [Tephrocybe rancida]|nr:hypothetical protein DXG01_003774 [Tephrocybe rancida]
MSNPTALCTRVTVSHPDGISHLRLSELNTPPLSPVSSVESVYESPQEDSDTPEQEGPYSPEPPLVIERYDSLSLLEAISNDVSASSEYIWDRVLSNDRVVDLLGYGIIDYAHLCKARTAYAGKYVHSPPRLAFEDIPLAIHNFMDLLQELRLEDDFSLAPMNLLHIVQPETLQEFFGILVEHYEDVHEGVGAEFREYLSGRNFFYLPAPSPV